MTATRRRQRSHGARTGLQTILNALFMPVAILDGRGRIVAANATWQRASGAHEHPFPSKTSVGDNYLAACRQAFPVHAEKAREALVGLQAVLDGSLVRFSLEYSSGSPKEPHWFAMHVGPLPGRGKGAVISHLDITDRKRLEDTLGETHTDTELARARLETLYATLPVGLIYVDQDLTVQHVSPQIAELHGRSIEEHLGRRLPDLIPSKRWATLKPIYDRVLKAGKAFHGLEEELPDPGVPGGRRYFLMDFYPDRNQDGTIRGLHGVMQEVTEQKQALKEQARYLKELEAKNRELDQKAIRDPLTGLYNRGFFDEVLDREWGRFQRSGEAFTVIIMDVDAFKAINDRYGHEVGDLALQQVGGLLRSSLRASDLVARVGGDEFAALLPRTDAARSRPVVEKLKKALKKLRLTSPEGAIPLSLSLGTATVPGVPPVTSAAELLRVADKRMYEAKRLASPGKPDAR